MLMLAWSDYLRLPNVGWNSRQIRNSCTAQFYLARDELVGYKSEERRKFRKKDWHETRCQEKVRSHVVWRSYRKPTQVDGERIPRRTGQCSFRNSAKKRPYLRYMAWPFICWVVRSKIDIWLPKITRSGGGRGSLRAKCQSVKSRMEVWYGAFTKLVYTSRNFCRQPLTLRVVNRLFRQRLLCRREREATLAKTQANL